MAKPKQHKLAMHKFAVIHLVIAAAAVVAATAETPAPVALPGCPTSCGNVSVPFPFGIGEGCYHSSGFNLTCDGTSTPPRLLLGTDGSFHVTRISLEDATVSVKTLLYAAVDGDAAVAWGEGLGAANWPFAVSYERNEFTLMGCNVEATLVGGGDGASCASFCNREGPALYVWDVPTKSCCGMGCCEVPIGMGRSSYVVRLRWLYPDHEHDAQTPVSVFVAEKGWFRGSLLSIAQFTQLDCEPSWFGIPQLRRKGNGTAPVVLDWAVPWPPPRLPVPAGGSFRGGSWTCSDDFDGGLCRSSNSYCVDVTSSNSMRSGYLCKCQIGYRGNPYLRDGCQDIDECRLPGKCYGRCTNTPGGYLCGCPQGTLGDPYKRNGCAYSVGISIVVGISGAVGLVLLVLGVIFLKQRIKAQRLKNLRQSFFNQNRGQLLLQMVSHSRADISERMIITLDEIEKATNNFDRARELGGGGHGIVYKGILSSLHVVAIKRSKIIIEREINEFINEVAILSQIKHRNIVKLIGCCLETEVPLLVYEFISNGTLYNHLHVNIGTSLSWVNRLSIAVQTARALAYLHSSISVPIFHRDIKSPNILLDDNLTAKLSDFGASRFIPVDQTGVDTVVQGTLGYLDPMYYTTGHFSDKSDVYSFGVLLMELLTRKKPDSYRSPEGFSLVKQFCNVLSKGNLIHILDAQIVDEGGREVDDVAKLATLCVELRCEDRPTMRQVEMRLEGIESSKETDLGDMERGRLEVNCNWEINSMSVEQTDVEQRHLHNYAMEEEPLLSLSYLHS